jgi:hypothetical protein
MTTTEAPAATGRIEMAGGHHPAPVGSGNSSQYTPCANYKEAKYLAASRRQGETSTSAIFVVALDCWCARVSAVPR